MGKMLKNEFWNGYTWFERMFFFGLVMMQVIAYFFSPDTPIGIVCGISGVICVALTAKGKISSYAFNFIQMSTYMFICFEAGLYLEFGEQVFYFIACIFGVIFWKKNMKKNEDGTSQVVAKKFQWWHWGVTALATVVTTIILGRFGDVVLGSTMSYLDACTVGLSVIAQLLMIWRYREQWAMWIAIDVASTIMFALIGQWSMVAMYVAWTANAVYGWYNWSKLARFEEEKT